MAGKNVVTAEGKPPLLDDDDMPGSITLKKLNSPNYLAWAHAVKIFFHGKQKL